MALQASAYQIMRPSFEEPELILSYTQASGAFDTLAGGEPRVRLGEGDLWVYMKRLDVRTKMLAGTAAPNQLPGVSLTTSMISTPTYLQRVRAQWDHHDAGAASRWGFALPEAYRDAQWQGHFQLARQGLLYGFNPQNGEGLLNAPGATAVNLPPDSNGNTTVISYDNGQMAFFLQQQVLNIKTRTNQLGIGRKFTILGPQQTLGQFEYNIVQLTQFQRVGAGTMSTAGVVKETLMTNGDTILWAYDDTLKGKGAGGTDAVLLVMPEIERPKANKIDTNYFANNMKPSNDTCVTMYADMAAPREIISPMAGGATDSLTEWRITGGWPVRSECITIISMQYQ